MHSENKVVMRLFGFYIFMIRFTSVFIHAYGNVEGGTYHGFIALQGKPWPVAEWKFYIAFSLFRGASIFAGIFSRWIMVYLQGIQFNITYKNDV